MPEQHTIPTKLLQDVVAYLARQPFQEVAQLIAALQQGAKAVEPPKVETSEGIGNYAPGANLPPAPAP